MKMLNLMLILLMLMKIFNITLVSFKMCTKSSPTRMASICYMVQSMIFKSAKLNCDGMIKRAKRYCK